MTVSAREKSKTIPQAASRKALSPCKTNHSSESILSDENILYNIGKTRFEVTPAYKSRGACTVTDILIKMLREDGLKRVQRP
jgi:hypothetical protein